MQIIDLPSRDLGQLDLPAINAQLREGTAQLDWSLVEEVSDEELAQLLQGLNAHKHGDVLGEETLGDALIKRVSAILEQNDRPEDLPALLQPKNPFELRETLTEMIYKDLYGPVGGEFEEVDEDSITERYLVGTIAPSYRATASPEIEEDPGLQDSLAVAGKKNGDDGEIEDSAPNSSLFPSSFGLTFCVAGDAETIEVKAQWGSYKWDKSEGILDEQGNPKTVWQRTPLGDRRVFTLKHHTESSLWVPDPLNAPEVVVTFRSRPFGEDWMVTVFLENNQTEPAQGQKQKEQTWLFQPELHLKHPQGKAIFVRRPLPVSKNLEMGLRKELESLQLLYRDSVEFAVGHNVSIHATPTPGDPQTAIALNTCFIPRHTVPTTIPREVSGLELDMKVLAEAPPEAIADLLRPLVTAYAQWLGEQTDRIPHLPGEPPFFRPIARHNLDQCRKTLARIQAGVTLLADNPQAIQAFQFMNRAMAIQRVRGIYAEQKRQGDPTLSLGAIDQPKNHRWRTFQLAFILLNLPSLSDPTHDDRQLGGLCDLLWFPTGGGKTEAYLGLTAYTLALRRLQGVVNGYDGNYGVAVLMRYTLRLLTLQQFQRATTLICACEAIRRENPDLWGREPFRIGLWVGSQSTPNWTRDSEEVIKQERGQQYSGAKGSPHQLTNCPWCGTKIDPGKDIDVRSFEKDIGRTLLFCGDPLGKCLFSSRQSPDEGLPVVVVDEEIYRRLPALLIATVDKFAQMPWNGSTQMLFGKVNGYCSRHGFRCPDLEDSDRHPARTSPRPLGAAHTQPHGPLRPPDLIIQDELHLISGPLGSLVGLYETAVDELCTWEVAGKKVRPKVIASTATIRQAQEQVNHLFLRQVQIFPPQAIDIQDNFFAQQCDPQPSTPGRLYLGICAPGRRLKAAVIRVYLVALSAAQVLMDRGYDADAWMTLVGYFNSLRELGGTRRLVDDDISTRLQKMEVRGLARRTIREIEELTSRKSSTDIPRILDALEKPFRRSAPPKKGDRRPLDVILATNMISVGVDVKRLGLMVACGQPKNTAEYIQATSRVGRNSPGLVLTIYNWARPRDLSHYERFEHYHATFYQHVEPLSVTPFSAGALDRGLAALLVSLVRLGGSDFNKQDGAAQMTVANFTHELLTSSIEAIAERLSSFPGEGTHKEAIKNRLEGLRDAWAQQAKPDEAGITLQYRASKRGGTTRSLLSNLGGPNKETFACLNSLRNVEPASPLLFHDRPPDNEPDRQPQPFSQS